MRGAGLESRCWRAPPSHKGLAVEPPLAGCIERVEEGAQGCERGAHALEKRWVAEGRHLDGRETRWRRVVHRTYGREENLLVSLTDLLALIGVYPDEDRTLALGIANERTKCETERYR